VTDSLLIVWDDVADAGELARGFESMGWDVELTRNLSTARRKIIEEGFEPLVTLADAELPDGRALDLLEQAKGRGPAGEWVLMPSECEPSESQGAQWAGIYDVLGKPCRPEKLCRVLAAARRSALAQRRLNDQRRENGRTYSSEAFLGRSGAARKVRDLLSRLAEVPFSALIIAGETGTGKGLAARILHSRGPQAHGPLVEVNCAALPRELLETELFGHQAGAFTGAKGSHRGYLEQADGGTLLLDEISEMEMDLQSKLLKAIEDRTRLSKFPANPR